MAVSTVLLAACGSSSPSSSPTTSSTTTTTPTAPTAPTGLQPTALGEGQCGAASLAGGSSVGQIAVASGTSCATASAVETGAGAAAGASYTASGFTCAATPQGPGSAWTASWGGTYVSYSCADGTSATAFNWGPIYTYDQTVGTSSATPFAPAPLGSGECQATRLPDGSTYAQIALSNAACAAVAYVAADAPTADGAGYTSNGYACTATKEGSGSTWASAWSGTYYAYVCTFGNQQLGFTWGKDYVYA
jgi:hypothetical protein